MALQIEKANASNGRLLLEKSKTNPRFKTQQSHLLLCPNDKHALK